MNSTTTQTAQAQKVLIRDDVRGNYLDAQFPGWGEPDCDDHLIPLASVAGMSGVVTSVESHGSYPWTRYSIRLSNGGHVIGAAPGFDFDWSTP